MVDAGPQSSTRLGTPFSPSTPAARQDSLVSSHLPEPEASTTNRCRSASSVGPSSPGRKCIGEEKNRSSVKPPMNRSMSKVPLMQIAARNRSGYRQTSASALNAPIEAPATITEFGPPVSAWMAGTTSWATACWNWLNSQQR